MRKLPNNETRMKHSRPNLLFLLIQILFTKCFIAASNFLEVPQKVLMWPEILLHI